MNTPEVCEKCGENKVKLTRRSTRTYEYMCPCDGKIVVGKYDQMEFVGTAAFRFCKAEGEDEFDRISKELAKWEQRAADDLAYHSASAPIKTPKKKPSRKPIQKPSDLSDDDKPEVLGTPVLEVPGDESSET